MRELFDHGAERAVLGSMILVPEIARRVDLPCEAFAHPFHRRAYIAAQEILADGDELSLVSLNGRLRDTAPTDEERDTTPARCAALLDGIPPSRNVDGYVDALKSKAFLRDLRAIGLEVDKWAADPNLSPQEVEDRQTAAVRVAREKWSRGVDLLDPDEMVRRLRRFYQEYDNRTVPTGYPTLDAILGEVHPGSVLTVIARPGIGKSNLGLNMIVNWLRLENDWGILLLSMEMPDTLAAARLVRMYQGWDRHALRHEMLSKGNPDSFLAAARGRLYVSARGGQTMQTIEESFERAEAALGRRVQVVVLDYLQYLRAKGRETPYEKMARLTAELKEFAKRRDILLVVLSQVGRGEAGGKGWECPSAEGARDSGTVEENADYLCGLARPDLDPAFDSKPDLAHLRGALLLKVLKGRNGGAGKSVRLAFDEETLRLEDAEWEDAAAYHRRQDARRFPD